MAKILHRGHFDDGLMRGEALVDIFQTGNELIEQLGNICRAGRVCYRSDQGDDTQNGEFINMLMRRGHHSVIEHSSLSVMFANVSRGFTHECVRHRLCAFSQESTRYCDYAGGKLDLEESELTFIMPPHQEIEIREVFTDHPAWGVVQSNVQNTPKVDIIEKHYNALRQNGWLPQDARQFLPIGIAAKIAVTANFREWRHIFAMRTQKAAHWEIRYVMYDLLTVLKTWIPVIFRDFVNVDDNGELLQDAQGYGYYKQIEWPAKGVG